MATIYYRATRILPLEGDRVQHEDRTATVLAALFCGSILLHPGGRGAELVSPDECVLLERPSDGRCA